MHFEDHGDEGDLAIIGFIGLAIMVVIAVFGFAFCPRKQHGYVVYEDYKIDKYILPISVDINDPIYASMVVRPK